MPRYAEQRSESVQSTDSDASFRSLAARPPRRYNTFSSCHQNLARFLRKFVWAPREDWVNLVFRLARLRSTQKSDHYACLHLCLRIPTIVVDVSRMILRSATVDAESHAPVNAADSDITVSSSDGVLFRVHKQNLSTHSEVIPEGDFSTNEEIVPLTETSETLELLFQYMYRQPQPDITDLPFEQLSMLAEAAEKYRVFSAMEICRVLMKFVLFNTTQWMCRLTCGPSTCSLI